MTPHHGFKMPHWKFEGTDEMTGFPMDRFCIARRYHIIVTRHALAPGWHISVRPWCSDRRQTVLRSIWEADVRLAFARLGVDFFELAVNELGHFHFHECPEGCTTVPGGVVHQAPRQGYTERHIAGGD